MDNVFLKLIIAAVVGITLIGSVLVPIINDNSNENVTYVNDGYFRASSIDADGSYSFTVGVEKIDGVAHWYVNGVDVPVNYTIAEWDSKQYIRTNYIGGSSQMARIYITGETSKVVLTSSGDLNEATFTFSNGQITMSNEEYDGTYEAAIVPDTNGGLLSMADAPMSLLKSSEVYLVGITNLAGVETSLFGSGTYDSLTICASTSVSGVTFTIADPQVSYDSLGNNGIKLEKIMIPITVNNSGTETETTATYTHFFVPYEVVINQDFDNSIMAMLSVMPLIMIIAIVIMFAGSIMLRRE